MDISVSAKPQTTYLFPIGFLIALLSIWLSKWSALSENYGELSFLSDLPFLSLTYIPALVAARFRDGKCFYYVSLPFLFLSLLLFTWYALDSIVYVFTTYHLTTDEIIRFSSQIDVLTTFLSWRIIAGAVCCLFLSLVSIKVVSNFFYIAFLTISLPIFLSPSIYKIVDHRGHKAGLWIDEFLEHLIPYDGAQNRFSKIQIAHALKDNLVPPVVELPQDKPNIILLIVESLSTKFFIEGGDTGLPLLNLRKLKQNGTYFTHFFANHRYSAGGIISLFHGSPPYPFPNARRSIHKSFSQQDSILQDFDSKGYFTEIIWPIDPTHYNFDPWVKSAGFDSIRTPISDKTLLAQDPEHFHPTSDRTLLEKLSERTEWLMRKESPFFITLETRTTHRPYFHPEGGAHTFEAVWKYADQQIGDFVRRLEELSYFDNGILLVLGDHRAFQLETSSEVQNFGDSAPARVPLLAIGKRFSPGYRDERLLQQADLFRKFSSLSNIQEPLSDWVIFVSRWLSFGERKARAGNLLVFVNGEPLTHGFKASVYGNSFRWIQKPPIFAQQIERDVTARRAIFQHFSDLRTRRCNKEAIQLLPVWREQLVDEKETPKRGVELMINKEQSLVDEIDFQDLSNLIGGNNDLPQRIVFRGFIDAKEEGTYWFRVKTDSATCLILGDNGLNMYYVPEKSEEFEQRSTQRIDPFFDGQISLRKGVYPFIIVLDGVTEPEKFIEFLWDTPNSDSYVTIPKSVLLAP